MANKVYQIIQEKFITMLQEAIKNGGTAPWKKPWVGGKAINYVSRKAYRGVNVFILPQGGEYITFNQISKLREKNPEIKLKKGCKKHLVVFWNLFEKEVDVDGEKLMQMLPLLRFYYVYHISDVENLPSKTQTYTHNDTKEEADKLIEEYAQRANIEIRVVKGSGSAFYSPSGDYINVPAKEQFENLDEYYSTVFHEISHSTGHPSRLSRFSSEAGSGMFNSDSYSKEELCAELTSAMILGMLGIDNKQAEQNSVAYLYGWMSKINEDISLIVSASAKAQKAADFIMGNTFEVEEEDENVA